MRQLILSAIILVSLAVPGSLKATNPAAFEGTWFGTLTLKDSEGYEEAFDCEIDIMREGDTLRFIDNDSCTLMYDSLDIVGTDLYRSDAKVGELSDAGFFVTETDGEDAYYFSVSRNEAGVLSLIESYKETNYSEELRGDLTAVRR